MRLTPTGGKWPLSNMKLSEDVHRCTAILERGDLPETVRLVVVKSVARDDEVVVWFSHELLAAMDVPFLNPVNIQGEKTYRCHRCGKVYEYPNPLKLHLARSCDKVKLADLWRRLADALRLHSAPSVVPRVVKPHEFILKLSLKETGNREKSKFKLRERPGTPPSPSLTSYSSPSPDRIDNRLEDQRPSSEPPRNSAFRPYGSPHSQMERLYPETSLIETASTFSNQQLQSSYCSKEIFLHNQAAEIETLVSNLGQSKQGHLCLYCGKIYSRKYGLKIHIRTHTGFKPLKCKYCLRPFGDPSNLNKHVRLHADTETPYRCDLCGKMLFTHQRRDFTEEKHHCVRDLLCHRSALLTHQIGRFDHSHLPRDFSS
ncbi:hypothetical protein GE061_019518 [Apolygus lucorum]|uniref:C2H2-type domain-containing protein n=1 Tax=Apolygus lucorum TaxID=248454 RepID=A0A6A4JJ37_APOLU|nr:hypothetical protein GE061_019518 [Apolygus lucorum]